MHTLDTNIQKACLDSTLAKKVVNIATTTTDQQERMDAQQVAGVMTAILGFGLGTEVYYGKIDFEIPSSTVRFLVITR